MKGSALIKVDLEGTQFYFRVLKLNEDSQSLREKGLSGLFPLLQRVEGEPVEIDGKEYTVDEMKAGELPTSVAVRIANALTEAVNTHINKISGKPEESEEKKSSAQG